jgi:hypothetical protein
MITNIINMLWVRGPLPWYAEASVRSFINNGHVVHLYSYERLENVPKGCHVLDAREILPETEVFTYGDGTFKGSLSGFADWFRFELLLQKGGWWSDSDVICLKRFEFCDEYVFASGWEPKVPNFVNNNVIFVGKPKSTVMTICVDECRRKKSFVRHAETGPMLLNRVVRENGLQRYILPPWVFNPVHYGDLKILVKPTALIRLLAVSRLLRGLRPVFINKNASALHLYSAIFERALPVRSLADLPRSSYLRTLLMNSRAMSVERTK